jgi:hypothetical protein
VKQLSGFRPNEWTFTLEGGYIQAVRANFEEDEDGYMQVQIQSQRTGLISKRKSPWLTIAFARVPNAVVHCDMWENERWNSETFIKSLHTAVEEEKL